MYSRTAFIICSSIGILIIYEIIIGYNFHLFNGLFNRPDKMEFIKTGHIERKQEKVILFYNSYFQWEHFLVGNGSQPLKNMKCPITNCYLTSNKSFLGTKSYSIDKFDAIIFHTFGLEEPPIINPRSPSQRYISFNTEPPTIWNYGPQFNNFFNWTVSYRYDSDFPRPYGSLLRNIPLEYPVPLQFLKNFTYPRGNATLLEKIKKEIASKKDAPELISWMVSNCETPSLREIFVENLRQFIDVDIYGKCGNLKCDIANHEGCLKELEKKYLFYLSFENSICEDYITEKFWLLISTTDIIPIVLDGNNHRFLAPEHSYINAQDFESPEELIKYLDYLKTNETAYAEYFEWKTYFRVFRNLNFVFCNICVQLNNPDAQEKSYENYGQWWNNNGDCIQKEKLPWRKLKL